MTRTRLGLLGLFAMVFGLMAFGATAAQAEVGARWLFAHLVGGVELLIPPLPAAIQLETEEESILHSEILKIKTLFKCTTIQVLNAKLQEEGIIGNTVVTNGSGLKEGRGSQVKFSNCITELNGAPVAECTPKDPVGGAGTIITKLGHALLKLHALAGGGTDDIVKILPDEGETLATIVLPAGCPIGTSVPVIGSLALNDCNNLSRAHLVKHLLKRFESLTELWTISKTAEHKATLLGSAWAFLTGEHVGLKFSGFPN